MGNYDPALLRTGNLFDGVPRGFPEELFMEIVRMPGILIERIVSNGQATPEGAWYDQPRHEWVIVLRGRARLAFENADDLELGPGDHLLIPAHCRHRVEWTSRDEPTVWLAVHFREQDDE